MDGTAPPSVRSASGDGAAVRAQYVTEQVALWIANDGDHYETAQMHARQDEADGVRGYPRLANYCTGTVTRAGRYGRVGTLASAWHVAQELAPNDFGRIRWADVAAELISEE